MDTKYHSPNVSATPQDLASHRNHEEDAIMTTSPAQELKSAISNATRRSVRSGSRTTTPATRFAPEIVQQSSEGSTSDESAPWVPGISQPTPSRKQRPRINTQDLQAKPKGKESETSSSSEDDAFKAATPYSFKRKARRRIFAVGKSRIRAGPTVLDPDDYLKKYPQDEYCKEMGPNARVWRVYLDEAARHDTELVETWRENLDVLLVFAGLFSAVVTTFVVQSSTDLKPDYTEVTARILAGRPSEAGGVVAGEPDFPINFIPQTLDRWINALWFLSLVFSLSTALISVLCKQWLQSFVKSAPGSARERVRVMQSRRDALETWRVETIIGFLPVSLHASLFIFFAGLALFTLNLDEIIGTLIGVFVSLTLAIYIIVTLLPLWLSRCPFVTPLTHISHFYLHHLLFRFQFQRKATTLAKHIISIWSPHKANVATSESESPPGSYLSLTEREREDIKKRPDEVDANALVWLNAVSSPNPTVCEIVVQAVAGLGPSFEYRDKLRVLVKNLPECLRPRRSAVESTDSPILLLDNNELESWLNNSEDSVTELYLRASQQLLTEEWSNPKRYSAWNGQTLYMSNLMLSRHPLLRDDIWPFSGGPITRLNAFREFTYEHYRGEKALKLRPYVWQQLLFQASSLMRWMYAQLEQRDNWQRDTTIFLLNQADGDFFFGHDLFKFADPSDIQEISLAQVPPGWLLYFLMSFRYNNLPQEPVALVDASFGAEIRPDFLLELFVKVLTKDSYAILPSDASKLLQAVRSLIRVMGKKNDPTSAPSATDLRSLSSISEYLYSAIAEGNVRPHSFMGRIDVNNFADIVNYTEEALLTYHELYTLHFKWSKLPSRDNIPLRFDVAMFRGLIRPVMLEATKRDANVVKTWLVNGRIDVMDHFVDSNALTILTRYSNDLPPEKDHLVSLSIILAFIRSAVNIIKNPGVSEPSRFLSYIMAPPHLEQCCKFIFHLRFTHNHDSKGQSWPEGVFALAHATKALEPFRNAWVASIHNLLHSTDMGNWRRNHLSNSGLLQIKRLIDVVGLDPDLQRREKLYIPEENIDRFSHVQAELRNQALGEAYDLKYGRVYLDDSLLELLNQYPHSSQDGLILHAQSPTGDGNTTSMDILRTKSPTHSSSKSGTRVDEPTSMTQFVCNLFSRRPSSRTRNPVEMSSVTLHSSPV